MAKINFDPELGRVAGFLSVEDDAENPILGHGKTLLNFLHWVAYTRAGRDKIHALQIRERHSPTERQQILDRVKSDLLIPSGVTNAADISAFQSAHEAAGLYVEVHEHLRSPTTPPAELPALRKKLDEYDKIYQMNMSFIAWRLWEHSLDHEFSIAQW